MAENTPLRLRVAIIGGGIAGLTLAVHLLKLARVHVDLYESSSSFSEIGAGIMIGWNALQVFKEMGLLEEYMVLARECWGNQTDVFFQYRFGDANYHDGIVHTLRMPGGQSNIHRADLLDLLIKYLPSKRVHFNKKLVAYEQTADSVSITFADDTSVKADVVVGADGVHSTVRKIMYQGREEESEPKWTGVFVYRGLVPSEYLVPIVGPHIVTTPTEWLGKNKHVVHYPISGGKTINMVAFVSDYSKGRNPPWEGSSWVEHDTPKADMLQHYVEWKEDIRMMLELTDTISKWGVFELPKLPNFVDGRVVLLGDAAHGMTPHQGNGGSQGIEGAYILSLLLSHPSVKLSTLTLALKTYESHRLPRAQAVQESSYPVGKLVDLSLEGVGDDESKFREETDKRYARVWGVDVRELGLRAVEEFEEMIGRQERI